MSGLNTNQQEAVDTLSGPLLVLAGAGTGKTRVITFRIANLIRSGVASHRILAMTFTNKAASEMKQRVGSMLGQNTRGKRVVDAAPTISTFHSLCVRILRRHIEALGYPQQFAIYSQGDQESLARTVLRQLDIGSLKPRQLLHWISHWKSKGWQPQDLPHFEPG